MPNEIYHRSNWGESKAEDFGDVYYDHAATNKLYNHSDYYENSDGTDATLKDLNNKASIVLTPTAYSDGSLNTVIPPYQVLPTELVTNGTFDTDSSWSKTNATISDGKATITVVGGAYSLIGQSLTYQSGKMYKLTAQVQGTNGKACTFFDNGSNIGGLGSSNGVINFDGNLQDVNITFTANSNSNQLLIVRNGSGDYTFTVDNVSVKEIQEADFDFSRGSSATRVNEQGLVEDVQILSGELVQNGNFEQIGSELVTNGDFDTDSDWSNSGSWSIGNGVATYDGLLNIKRIYQTVNFVQNKIYKISFDITNTVDDYIDLFIGQDATALIGRTDYAVGSYEFYVTATSTSQNFNIYAYNTSYSGGSIDNISVKEVGQNWSGINGATLSFDSNRAVVTIAAQSGSGLASDSTVPVQSGKKYKLEADVEIGTYTGTSVILNLLGTSSSAITIASSGVTRVSHIFNASSTTNTSARVLRGSADTGTLFIDNVSVIEITDDTDLPRIDFTDGTGSLLLEPQRTNLVTYSEDFSQSVWTKNDVTVTSGFLAPDGTNTAYKVTKNGSNAHLVGFSGQNTNKRKSIWARTVSGTGKVTLLNVTTDTNALFDITEQWQRFDITHSGADFFYAVDFRNASATLTEVLIWGAQVEDGDYATSYIPTSGSTVTRSADVANNSGNADLFNDSEGVLYAEIAALANDGTYRSLGINSGSATNRLLLTYRPTDNQINYLVQVGGVTQVNILYVLSDATTYNKIALSYKENDFKLFVNGTQVDSDTSGSVFSANTLSELSFDNAAGADNFYGDAKCVAVFKEALSNDLLERLTGEGYESFRLLAEANNYTII